VLSLINKRYVIEREIKEQSVDEKYQQRQEKSIPVLKQLKTYLEENQHKAPKDSLTGKAMTYLSNPWKKLNVYCTHGELNISNTLAKNAIRPFVVRRKAWLFSDTPAGAHCFTFMLIQLIKSKLCCLGILENLIFLNRDSTRSIARLQC